MFKSKVKQTYVPSVQGASSAAKVLINDFREAILIEATIPGKSNKISEIMARDTGGDLFRYYYDNDLNLDSVEYQDPAGNTCLLLAIAFGCDQLVDLILDNAKQKLNETVFQNFINFRYHDLSGSKPWYSNTALTLAIKKGKFDIAKKLLDEGANPNAPTENGGFNAMHLLYFLKGTYEHAKNLPSEDLKKVEQLIDMARPLDQRITDYYGNIPEEHLDTYQNIQYKNLKCFVSYSRQFSKDKGLEIGKPYSIKQLEQKFNKNWSEIKELAKNNYGTGLELVLMMNTSGVSYEDDLMQAFSWGPIITKIKEFYPAAFEEPWLKEGTAGELYQAEEVQLSEQDLDTVGVVD